MTTVRVFINNQKKSSYGLENSGDQLNDSILPESSIRNTIVTGGSVLIFICMGEVDRQLTDK